MTGKRNWVVYIHDRDRDDAPDFVHGPFTRDGARDYVDKAKARRDRVGGRAASALRILSFPLAPPLLRNAYELIDAAAANDAAVPDEQPERGK